MQACKRLQKLEKLNLPGIKNPEQQSALGSILFLSIYLYATTSISISTSLGIRAASTQERAG